MRALLARVATRVRLELAMYELRPTRREWRWVVDEFREDLRRLDEDDRRWPKFL